MSGSARGKLKEELEGIHTNMQWIILHSARCIDLIGDSHPEITTFFKSLVEEMTLLDEGTAKIYGTI